MLVKRANSNDGLLALVIEFLFHNQTIQPEVYLVLFGLQEEEERKKERREKHQRYSKDQ